MQATVPEELRTNTLKDIPENITVYTVPWAMEVDDNGLFWLNEEYLFYYYKCETSTLKVTKNKNGWIVDVSNCGRYDTMEYNGKINTDKCSPIIDVIK